MKNQASINASVTQRPNEQKIKLNCTAYMDAYLNNKREKMWTHTTTAITATIGVSILLCCCI